MDRPPDPYSRNRTLRRGRRHRRAASHPYPVEHNANSASRQSDIDDDETAITILKPTKLNSDESPTPDQVLLSSGEPIMCPICLEACENIGSHRITSLACGHLFGEKCVLRWLSVYRSCCPTCQMDCQTKDIRTINASHVILLDRTLERRLHAQIRTLRQRVAELNQQLEDE